MSRLWSSTMLLLLCTLAATTVQPDCGTEQVLVDTDDVGDRRVACSGVHRALKSLASCEYTISETLHIRFMAGGDKEKFIVQENGSYTNVPTSGYYLRKPSCVYVETRRMPVADRTPAFGHLPMSDELLISTVAHEVTHHVHHHLCASRGRVAPRAASEYLAYVVQLDTMAEPKRSEVLDCWPSAVLPSRQAVNHFVWASNPPRFGVMAYRFHQADPGFFCDILAGRYHASDRGIPAQ
ncbi:MAG: hypothetical protein P1P84_03870 [Deferrisomatales bacterium]|nr:hypothetical protein [Deferrisomatales bacterium]